MTEAELKRVLVVIPAYNAARYLSELIKRCRENIGDSHLLFVNDGSTDDSLTILKQEDVNYVSFPDNRGKGAALKAGFDYALKHGFEAVLTLDADLQHLPEEIPRFLEANDGRHLVIGTREIDSRTMPLARWLVNNLRSVIISIFSTQRVRDSQSGFRLIPVGLLRSMRLDSVKYDFESEILFKAGALNCAVAEVPVTTVYEGSHSYIHPMKDTWRFIRQIWGRIWT